MSCLVLSIGFRKTSLEKLCGSPAGKFDANNIFFSEEELLKSEGFGVQLENKGDNDV